MTAREAYEYALIEQNKVEAPSMLLEDYNYLFNKSIQQYFNLTYPKWELDQQTSDDLRVLKTSAVLVPYKIKDIENYKKITDFGSGLFSTSYYVDLPKDYVHLVSCIVQYDFDGSKGGCSPDGESIYFPARRLTSELYSQIIRNAYLKPNYNRPYYYLNSINTSADYKENVPLGNTGLITAYREVLHKATDLPTNSQLDQEVKDEAYVSGETSSKNCIDAYTPIYDRRANVSTVRLELRFGNNKNYIPKKVYVDYLKAPMYVRLTQDQIDATEDHSQVLEFPDYVCYEIINIFTKLLMENASDPRIQTHYPTNQTITNPSLQTAVK